MISDSIIDLGCVGHCDTIITDICIEKAGTYYLRYNLDRVYRFIKIVTTNDGEKLTIPGNELPLNREVILQFLDSNQEVMTDGEFDTIRLNTMIKLIKE